MSYWDLEFQFCRKVIIFGESNVGKTCFAKRCELDTFIENPMRTIGVNLWKKKIEIDNVLHTFQFWDFSGEHKFRDLLGMYLKGVDMGIFMFDLTNLSSLLCFDYWMDFVKEKWERPIPIIIIGTKGDISKEEISTRARQFCEERNYPYYLECSSKTGDNIDEVFQILKELVQIIPDHKAFLN
jgi:Ras-related protein Rab-1A